MAKLSIPQDEPVSDVVVDGVHRLEATGISVLVAGGGIGGRMAALECWRQGHDVQILEKASKVETIGDAFGILPPALATFRFFPAMHKQFEAESYDAEMSAWSHEGHKLHHFGEAAWNLEQPDGLEHPAKGVRVPWIEARFKFVLMLAAQCDRLGISTHFGEEAIEYSEDSNQASVKTKNGTVYHADIVVAADGVGTKSHSHVTGETIRAQSSGYSAYRCILPTSLAKDRLSSAAKEDLFSADRPEFRLYLARTMHANIIILPDFVVLMLTHKDNGGSEESWHARASPDVVLRTLQEEPGWDKHIIELFSLLPKDGCIDWKLVWRDPQPKWTSDGGRVVQLGDAAHSFLPTSGNGATQAMEDALSLATCLRLAGKSSAHIATKVHTKLRFERVSTIQHYGFINRQMMHNTESETPSKSGFEGGLKHSRWIWSHDPHKYASDNFDAGRAHLLKGHSFENTNLPPGAGYRPWTMAEELENEHRGVISDLKEHGDWS